MKELHWGTIQGGLGKLHSASLRTRPTCRTSFIEDGIKPATLNEPHNRNIHTAPAEKSVLDLCVREKWWLFDVAAPGERDHTAF